MKSRNMLVALAGLTMAGALALTGCTNTASPEDPATGSQGPDEASAFLACLTAADVEAKINASGQVLVKVPGQPGDGGQVSSGDGSGAGLLGMEGDEAGNTWVAVQSADYFADTPDVQDAYAACEAEHPNFVQAQFDPSSNPDVAEELEGQEEAALAFAQCARENGFSQIADPDAAMGGAILIPDGFSESDFRALAEECYDPASSFAFASSEDLGFDPWMVLEEFQNAPAS
ncbi:hypothetical protein BSP109_02679 [Brevibacterium sp. Mu109]|nr:hypothetical protein BSP109_02679 [Brevibacterium sp. Mu109]